MSLSDIINLDDLLSPISDEMPAGPDLRESASPSSDYQKIKTARSAARAAERNSIHDGDTNDADEHWRLVISLAPAIIEKQSKDLEVATWFTEALVRRHGFEGIYAAFNLIKGLIENFWDDLHPRPDEDGMETRTSSLAGLNGEGSEGVLIAPLRKIPITEGFDPGPFCLWQYQQALEADRAADEETRAERSAKLGFSVADIDKAVGESSSEFFSSQIEFINEAVSAYRTVSDLLDEHCGINDAPPTRTIIDVLEECGRTISHIAQNKLPQATDELPQDDGSENTVGATPVGSGARAGGPINSREDAFKQLSEISRFFLASEPHSPIAYVLEKAVRWGRMSLDELIVELIPDDSSRRHFGELTGIKNNDD